MRIESLKKEATQGIVKIINEELAKRVREKDREIQDFNAELIHEILKEHESVPLLPLDKQVFIKTKESISQRNYRTPVVINGGKLLEWQEIQGSRIYRTTNFPIEIPMLIPTGYSAIGFVNNIKYSKEIHTILETMAMKVIGAIPDGLFRVAIIDKDATGASFSNFMMFNGKITESKIISKDDEIAFEMQELRDTYQRVAKNLAHNGFRSVEEYNRTTEEIPQPYKIIMIANFPHGFDKEAAENLLALLESPEKAGYYFFISFALPLRFDMDYSISGIPIGEFLKKMTVFNVSNRITQAVAEKKVPFASELLTSPLRVESDIKVMFDSHFNIAFEKMDGEFAETTIGHINKRVESMNLRPVIYIEKTIPQKIWTDKPFKGIAVPFAKNGIEDVYFSIGINQYGEDESTHHAMICGTTGSGKTVTLHDIILHSAMKYSPDTLKYWLLDYKEGTEFAIYRDFPFVEILSMESEIEFGHEVLSRVIAEMGERGKYFKMVDARNLQEYHENRQKKIDEAESEEEKRKLEEELPYFPRVIVIIDEFQALYPNVQFIKNKTNEYISDILRRGRSFGFNLILSTQTLKGVDLSEDIMSNIPLRIALKMDEKDAIKLFNEQNTAPKFLKFAGEGIYNSQFGESIKNVPFQAYFAREEAITKIKDLLLSKIDETFKEERKKKLMENRFVYVGNIPGRFDKKLLEECRENKDFYTVAIGEPAGLSRHMANITIKREYANNLIAVGHETVKAASIFKYMLDQLIASPRKKKLFFSNTVSEQKVLFREYEKVATIIDNKNYEPIIYEIYQEMEKRMGMPQEETESLPDIFIVMFFINSLLLFSEDSFNKASAKSKFLEIVKKGPEVGIHSLLYTDSYTSIINFGISQAMGFFGKKISLGFSENDLKIFALDGGYIEKSKSPVVSVYTNGDQGNKVFKFKPFISSKAPGSDLYLSNFEE